MLVYFTFSVRDRLRMPNATNAFSHSIHQSAGTEQHFKVRNRNCNLLSIDFRQSVQMSQNLMPKLYVGQKESAKITYIMYCDHIM